MELPEIPHSEAPALSALETLRFGVGRNVDALQSAILAQSVESEALRRQLRETMACCDQLQTDFERHAREKQEFALEIAQRDEELAQLSNSHAALQTQHGAIQTKNARLTEEVAQMSADLERAHVEHADLRDQLAHLHHDLAGANALPQLTLKLAAQLTGAQVGLFVQADGDDTLADLGLESLDDFLKEALYDFTRKVAASEAPLIENDAQKLPDGAGLVNLAALPVAIKGEMRGVLLLANKRSGPFTDSDTRILFAIGQHAGLAMRNARLHHELSNAYASTVAVLADAIEAKDAYTRGHCEDVSRLAVEVARRLGLEKELLEQVRYAALLHDIGKIGVPDGILLKPGALMPEEFLIIQKHSQIGHDLVARVPSMLGLSHAILHHHEKYDGSGYPQGLCGEGIPLASRIVCAVDAFNAMTTPRPYRQPVSVEEALAEMKLCAGTHFDPKIVELVAEIVQSRDA